MLSGRVSGEFLYDADKIRVSSYPVKDRGMAMSEIEISNIRNNLSDFYSLVYIYGADALVYVDGEKRIVPKNSMVLVDRFSVIIECAINAKRANLIALDFKSELFGRIREDAPDFCNMLKYIMDCDTDLDVTIPKGYYLYDKNRRLRHLFENSKEEYKERKLKYIDIIKDNIRNILIEIARDLNCFDERSVGGELLQRIVDYCELHVTEKITLKDISEKFNYSESHITKVCKKELGLSFAEFLRQKKIYYACGKLSGTDYKVSNIARMAGFQDIPSFTECFEKYIGMTPSEYRKNSRKTNKWFIGMDDLRHQNK
jgi:AraC-like DNA-binding protein